MRKTPTLVTGMAALGLLAAATLAAAQEATLNRVADGGFESGFVSLSLPAGARLPMFSGGWASRGSRTPEIIGLPGGYQGARAVRVASRADDPLLLFQDLPFNGPGFGLRVAFRVEEGSQTIRLLTDWGRRDPAGSQIAFAVTIHPASLTFTTPGGRWEIPADLAAANWHTLSVLADPRSGVQSIDLDGRQVLALPGVPAQRPATLLLGGIDRQSGSFLYDAVEVVSLVDLEIGVLQEATVRLDLGDRSALLGRLDAVVMALDRGAPALALPELDAARKLLGWSRQRTPVGREGAATSLRTTALIAEMERAVDSLIELIEIDARERGSQR
jgi:hypothetical protein